MTEEDQRRQKGTICKRIELAIFYPAISYNLTSYYPARYLVEKYTPQERCNNRATDNAPTEYRAIHLPSNARCSGRVPSFAPKVVPPVTL